jgi:large subunit ribosomal protein L15
MADEKTPQEAAPAAAASAADAPARPARARRPAAAKAPVEAPAAAEAPAAPTATAPAARVLKVHHLRPAPGAKTARTRVGRGEASKGKSAGRGTKGSKARYQVSAAFEGGQMPLHMRLPKLRGFTSPFRTEYQVVNLDRLSELFPDGGEVGVEQLVAKGAVRPKQRVKVLGTGEITVAVRVTAHAFSASAEQKIAAAGGAVTRA